MINNDWRGQLVDVFADNGEMGGNGPFYAFLGAATVGFVTYMLTRGGYSVSANGVEIAPKSDDISAIDVETVEPDLSE